jgi:Xaa-Pro aminopeptidase
MFSKETYQQRRATLRTKMQGRGLILFLGHTESPINYPNNAYNFRQDSSFLYFFGHSLPDLAGVIDTDSGEETLFGDDFTVSDIIWMGPQPSIADMASEVGVTKIAPSAALAEVIARAVAMGREIHILPPYRGETKIAIQNLIPGGLHPSQMLIEAIVGMRDKKSNEEIAQIEEACDTGYLMHTTAMRMCRAGVVERQIAGAIEGIARQGGWGTSFHSIVSQHGETLHNHNYNGVLQSGRLLLVDAGAEAVSGYSSDFTRTMPVSGKFTAKQKDVYDIVLAANNRAFEIARPDMRYVDVHLASARVLIDGLKGLGMVRGDVDEAVMAGVHALFMPHGLGHQMGLDVHDMEDLGQNNVGYNALTPYSDHPSVRHCRMARALEPGMVVTVEPGIYFIPAYIAQWKAEGTCAEFIDYAKVEEYLDFGGIRLEDDMLVTATGNRMLGSHRIPITTSEVEDAMQN